MYFSRRNKHWSKAEAPQRWSGLLFAKKQHPNYPRCPVRNRPNFKKTKTLQRPKVSVEFGKPLYPKEAEKTGVLTKRIMQELREMLPKKHY